MELFWKIASIQNCSWLYRRFIALRTLDFRALFGCTFVTARDIFDIFSNLIRKPLIINFVSTSFTFDQSKSSVNWKNVILRNTCQIVDAINVLSENTSELPFIVQYFCKEMRHCWLQLVIQYQWSSHLKVRKWISHEKLSTNYMCGHIFHSLTIFF